MINFHGSTGYGSRSSTRSTATGRRSVRGPDEGLGYAEKTYPFIDQDRVCALGASYGGYAINWILATPTASSVWCRTMACSTPSRLGTTKNSGSTIGSSKALLTTIARCTRNGRRTSTRPISRRPPWSCHGQLDYRLDVSEGFQLFTTLQSRNVPSKMLYFPDEGHWVLKPQNSRLWYQTVNDWVDQWTKK